jgi:hypothetical protein
MASTSAKNDHLHAGAPLYLTERVIARLCATVDPETGAVDGPYVVVDSDEWTLDHTRDVGRAVIALVESAESMTGQPGPHLA